MSTHNPLETVARWGDEALPARTESLQNPQNSADSARSVPANIPDPMEHYRCFHCKLIFGPEMAREHFGEREKADPPMCLRELAERVDQLERELTDFKNLHRLVLEELTERHGQLKDLEREKAELVEALRKAINDCFGGMGKNSAIWGNSPYDKGRTAGVLSALTAFDAARARAEAERKEHE